METDTTDYIDKMQIKGSPENEAFFAYSKFANERGKRGIELDKKLKEAREKNDTATANKLREQLRELYKEMDNYRKNVMATTPNFLVAKIFRIMEEVD